MRTQGRVNSAWLTLSIRHQTDVAMAPAVVDSIESGAGYWANRAKISRVKEGTAHRRVWLLALAFAAGGTVAGTVLSLYSVTPVPGLLLNLGQLAALEAVLFGAGLASGLAGFGFSAVGAAVLLLIPPVLGIPLLQALSTANQMLSIGQLRREMPRSLAGWWLGPGPYILGGVLGVPLGIWLLNTLPEQRLMLVFGLVLVAYAAYSIANPIGGRIRGFAGPAAGAVVGFLGGTFGGFTAFPGAAVVVWTGLRDLPRAQNRAIVQPFILVLQLTALATNAILHPAVFGSSFWGLLALTLPVVLSGTLSGVLLYRRVSDVNFRRVCSFLLGLAGAGLLAKVLLA